MSHEQAAQTINDQGVHILIDLMGHTRFNRLQANQQRFSKVLSAFHSPKCSLYSRYKVLTRYKVLET
jgi:predicted O-linked N-acetylglucosamine transferase (SPINDLY family)